MEENPLKTQTILLVDDDRFLRDMYAVKFKEKGFTVEMAESATEALEKLRGGLTARVIMFDVVMPGIDGYGFLESMRSEKIAEASIKIALSNQGGDSDIEKAKALGASEYIVKANSIPSEVVTKVLAAAGIK